ncbi:hypothetical protein Tco_0028158 [Tanacetum coccineum]
MVRLRTWQCFKAGGNDSGGGGKGLSMVELGLWDKTGWRNPPNDYALRKCIIKGPYTPTIVTTPAVPATEDSPAVL